MPHSGEALALLAEMNKPISYGKEYDFVDATTSYLGESFPGTATSAAAWRIQRFTFDVSGDVTIEWADGNAIMDNVWDNRAALSYS